jgi:erythromycin esterase-like protein
MPPTAGFFDRFVDRRVVLLGKASHGTSEFYRARAAITQRLIERHGFTIVAVEADWPDAAAVDRFVHGAFQPGCGGERPGQVPDTFPFGL